MTRDDVGACTQASKSPGAIWHSEAATDSTITEPTMETSVALIRNWPITLLCALFFPLLLGLGAWQLQRAGEKSAINAAIDARLSAQPRSAAEITTPQKFAPIRLTGRYTDEHYLLDNRTRNGRIGYEALQVFESSDQRWLVNRGWLAAPSRRDALPEVQRPHGDRVITGFLYPVVAGGESTEGTKGGRIQQIDGAFAGSLELARPGWSLRLSADSDTALVTDWQLINSPPERHRAYAVQWFAMAAALLLLWLYAATGLIERIRANKRQDL